MQAEPIKPDGLRGLVDGLQTAGSSAEFEAIAQRFCHQAGHRWFAYVRERDGRWACVSSFPKHWLAQGFARPAGAPARIGGRPGILTWNDQSGCPVLGIGRRTGPSARAPLAGLTVAIPAPFGAWAAFALARDAANAAVAPADADPNAVLVFAAMFHAYVQARGVMSERDTPEPTRDGAPTRPRPILSQRQRECLVWASRGKTVRDIAAILRVRPRTVSFHLDRARAVLGAHTLTQAVAIAERDALLD